MRDPERIPEVLDLLRKLWERYPQQRLTQLVLNACRHLAGNGWPDVWNVEDTDLLKALQNELGNAEYDGRTWVLWGQDDNGKTFVVSAFPTPDEAEAERKSYQDRGHKQHYWVEEKQIDEQGERE